MRGQLYHPLQVDQRRTVDALERAKSRQRKVSRLMAVYWGIATAIASGLLANSASSEQAMAFSVTLSLVIATASSLVVIWFIARQSGIQLHNLFVPS